MFVKLFPNFTIIPFAWLPFNIMGDKLCLQLCGFLKFLARIQDVLFTKTNNLGTNKEINV